MNLTVEWADELYPDSNENSIGVAGQFPVIRVATLREWLMKERAYAPIESVNDYNRMLAQLPEEP